jgi:hypothetical protein
MGHERKKKKTKFHYTYCAFYLVCGRQVLANAGALSNQVCKTPEYNLKACCSTLARLFEQKKKMDKLEDHTRQRQT